MAKKLVKKQIVTANLTHLPENDKLVTIGDIAQALINNPTYVSGLTPTAASVQSSVTTAQTLITKRDNAKKLAEQYTQQVNDAISALETIVVSQWANQVQNATGMTADRIKTLNFGIKGIVTGHVSTTVATEKVILLESTPMISKIDRNTTGQHTLEVKDSISKKRKLPAGIKRIDLYGQTDGTQPTSLADLMANGGGYIGTFKRHKFVNVFPAAIITGSTSKKGKPEFYIAVYIDKDTLKPTTQSPVVSALIN